MVLDQKLKSISVIRFLILDYELGMVRSLRKIVLQKSPTSLWSLETRRINNLESCIHILCFWWIRNLMDRPNIDYHKISDPEPQRHSRKIFFINPEKYWTDTSCLHFWSDLDQNCENDAFLTGKLWAIPLTISFPFFDDLAVSFFFLN